VGDSQRITPSDSTPAPAGAQKITHLKDITPAQWKSGIAAWLGWLFDGLEMHLFSLIATIFVAELLHADKKDPDVAFYSSWIQAAFLMGWALGGAFFGIIGDRIGRTRALMLTILVYAVFTGLSFFAQAWWHVLIFRFISALGIGGEWALGSSLLSETWPSTWRPWLAAVLQCAVNCGILLATLAVALLSSFPPRTVFLVGVIPAFVVLWIRRAVPEPEVWHQARTQTGVAALRFSDLFRGKIRRTSILTVLVCGLSLTGHWAFMFWCLQHFRNLPDLQSWTEAERTELVSWALFAIVLTSMAGNFIGALLARKLGYRHAIVLMFLGYFGAMTGAYCIPRTHNEMWIWLAIIGICSGAFALFTMYLPPLFPTLLRTTGAGFCYNIGRLAAAFGTVFFGLFTKVGDYRVALLYTGFLFIPAAAFALLLPEPPDE
jgi:MFS family permease